MNKQPVTYILASARNGTLYIGVTSNLIQRIWQHKNNQAEGFTEKYRFIRKMRPSLIYSAKKRSI